MDTHKFPAILGCLVAAFAVAGLQAQEADAPESSGAMQEQLPAAPIDEQVPVAEDSLEDQADQSLVGPAAADAVQEQPPAAPVDEQVPVAEEGLEEQADESLVGPAASDAGPVQPDANMLLQEFEHFKQLFQEGALDEADIVAKRVIELAIATKGPRSNEMAKALTNLAIVQHRSRQFDAAQQNYEAAIDIIEENEDRLNEQLVNPLRGLAAAQLESGRPDLASDTYNRAIHVTHVNEGPHNLEQIDLLEDLAEVQLRMGNVDEAKNVQDRIYALNTRAYDMDTLEIIPALERRAKWQHRAGFIYDERASYRRIIRIIEDQEDKTSVKLVEPLLALGRSYFFLDTSGQATSYQAAVGLNSGEIYFKRAQRIASESPDATWQMLANATLNLGDYYMYDGNTQHARQTYREVWDLLSEPEGEPDRLQMRYEQLESLVTLKQRPIPGYVGDTDPTVRPPSTDDPVLRGTVSVSYDISSRGRAANLKLVEADPPEFASMQNFVQREIRSRIFRPVYVAGEPADSKNHLFIHTYYYRQSDLDAARESGEAGSEAAPDEADAEDESG